MTTFTDFVTALSNMWPAGVQRVFKLGETPPASLNDADLPAMWVQLPKADYAIMTFASGLHWPRITAQVVVAVIASAQGMSLGTSFAKTLVVIDGLVTALSTVRPTGTQGSKPVWTMRTGGVNVAGIDYWAVIADVTASG
jgi:hypothetical protein